MAKSIIGFDIGSGELKLALWDGALIRRVVREPLLDNLVREGRITSFEAMGDFIKECAKKHRVSGRDCAVVLPSGQAFLRRISLPAMSVEQLAVNLPYEFRDYLTMGKDQYFYDYAVNALVRGEDGAPAELDLTAAAVPKQTIGEYRDMFRRAGFKLRAAAPAECAYSALLRARAAASTDAAEKESCILDLGHAATRIHIFTGGRFEASRVIEYGSGTVDAAVADAMGVDEHVARTLKEADHEGVQALEGPRNIYAAIAVEIMKAINFYGFNNRESNLRDAYCCGGGTRIPLLMEAVDKAVDLEMHGIDTLLPPAARTEENLSSFAAAVGIAMTWGGKTHG